MSNNNTKILYHGTPDYNINSILKKGLIPSYNSRYNNDIPKECWPDHNGVIFLTNNIEKAIEYGGWLHNNKISILTVKVKQSKCIKCINGYDFLYPKKIKPKNIIDIKSGLENNSITAWQENDKWEQWLEDIHETMVKNNQHLRIID
jgi:hypothetical protein